MKQFFQQKKQNLNLVNNTEQELYCFPDPKSIQLRYTGFSLIDTIKKKTPVYQGMPLAEHPSASTGDLFSPISGVVDAITNDTISIKAIDNDTESTSNTSSHIDIEQSIKIPYNNSRGSELAFSLKKSGVSMHSLTEPCKTLIINALNPEPGITWANSILKTEQEVLKIGLEVCKNVAQAKKIVLVLPESSKKIQFYNTIPVVYVKPIYPQSLDPLIIKAVTNKESSKDTSVISIHTVWSIGRVMTLKQPLTETILTIANSTYSKNYTVKDGTSIYELLKVTNLEVNNGDIVIHGGLFQGESIDHLQYSVTKNTKGIFITNPTTLPSMGKNYPCISCSACVAICPARLNPDLLSRYTEFGFYEKCRKEFIESCFECGLCSYVCVARRPILQHIRLAKHKLNLNTVK